MAKDSLEYADNPNFEAPMPKYNETLDILVAYRSKWADTADLDMDDEIEALRAEVQAAWDAASPWWNSSISRRPDLGDPPARAGSG